MRFTLEIEFETVGRVPSEPAMAKRLTKALEDWRGLMIDAGEAPLGGDISLLGIKVKPAK